MLAILIGSQSINLLILMHVDESSAWSFDGSWSMWKGLFGSLSLQGLVRNVYAALSKLWHIDWQESVASVLSGDWTEMSKAAAAWIWARAMEVTISEELVNVAKWSALGMIVWVWCVYQVNHLFLCSTETESTVCTAWLSSSSFSVSISSATPHEGAWAWTRAQLLTML